MEHWQIISHKATEGLVQQRFGVMGADVLRMKICAKFELCASYQVLC